MDTQTARRRLEEARERLERLRGTSNVGDSLSLGATDVTELSSYDQHPADSGSETFEQEKEYSVRLQIKADLADVERALRRLDDGTYGTCEACGRPIEEARLEARPAARFCRDDQQRAEREAAAGKGAAPMLGPGD